MPKFEDGWWSRIHRDWNGISQTQRRDRGWISIGHAADNVVERLRRESFAHRGAKQLMARWLRAAAAEVGTDNYADFPPPVRGYDNEAAEGELRWIDRHWISWRVNRPGPSWGVWTEYPLGLNREGDGQHGPVWDERDERYEQRPPTFDELRRHGVDARYIVDIAIQHKGLICDIVEIVHKNPLDEEKLAFLQGCVIGSIWEIPARWVLGQIDVPIAIPDEFRVYG